MRKAASNKQESSVLHLGNQMCFALYSTSLTMTKLYKPLLSALNLTYPQYLVLLALWEKDRISVSALGESLFLDSGTLTPLLKRLETLGYVKRQRDKEDERRVLVSLTAAGHGLRKRVAAVHDQVACATQCSVSERQALTRRLARLRTALALGVLTGAAK